MQTASADRHETLDGVDPAAAISTVGLRKVYTRGRSAVVALEGLDLSVSRGEFFGLLGTNGAGKSTTLGMLTTLVTPTAGQAWVAGREVGIDPVMTTLTQTLSRPTSSRTASWRAYVALTARDVHVLRRSLPVVLVQVALQPLLFTFAFAYVMPSIGRGLGGSTSLSTILLPGLMASTLLLQSIMSVSGPLANELGATREITDRALAPLPVWALGLPKITSSAIFGLVSTPVVVLIVWFVHAPGAAPEAHVANWPLFLLTLVLCALLASAVGLLLGTVIDAAAGALLPLLLTAATMLGCVYYPWSALRAIEWVQVLTLTNPLVYMSEGLRASLTPGVGHMPTWAYLSALTLGTAALSFLAVHRFSQRVRT